jgi:hypothetical protein
MNKYQERVLTAVIVAVALVLLFPPYHQVGPNGYVSNAGYSWIFQPPPDWPRATVDIPMLLTQWFAVFVVGGLAYVLAARLPQPSATQSGTTTGAQPTSSPFPWLIAPFVALFVLMVASYWYYSSRMIAPSATPRGVAGAAPSVEPQQPAQVLTAPSPTLRGENPIEPNEVAPEAVDAGPSTAESKVPAEDPCPQTLPADTLLSCVREAVERGQVVSTSGTVFARAIKADNSDPGFEQLTPFLHSEMQEISSSFGWSWDEGYLRLYLRPTKSAGRSYKVVELAVSKDGCDSAGNFKSDAVLSYYAIVLNREGRTDQPTSFIAAPFPPPTDPTSTSCGDIVGMWGP